jgi:sugar O-acyltransferase (sialic acid O-acetyltransferase NeuD family)
MDKIIIIGNGGHANACVDVIESTGQYEIIGFIQRENDIDSKPRIYKILGNDSDLPNIRKKISKAFIAVGQIKSPQTRIKLFQKLRDLKFDLPTVISPNAYVSKTATIGRGTIIMHHVVINANAIIGDNCIINNKALVEHDVIIGDNCHISTGAILNGNCNIKNEVFIGSGTICKHNTKIEENSIIDAGKYISEYVKPNSLIK